MLTACDTSLGSVSLYALSPRVDSSLGLLNVPPFEMPGMELESAAHSGFDIARDLYPAVAYLLGLLLDPKISLRLMSALRCQ